MGRYGLGTRLAMIVIGGIWLAVGGFWLAALFRRASNANGSADALNDDRVWVMLSGALATSGFMLVKTGIAPDRPKSFEHEVPDAHPDLEPADDD